MLNGKLSDNNIEKNKLILAGSEFLDKEALILKLEEPINDDMVFFYEYCFLNKFFFSMQASLWQ